ncbi:sce7726 family protein, partial [bacterium]|nr:sce7726 family protein [bacterium]
RTAACKADCVVLNGTSNVYEVKSDYDSMDRLANQLAAYRKVFDCIRVITSERLLPKVSAIAGDWVGLSVLRARGSIGDIKKPISMKHAVLPEVIFDSLRRPEYENIVLCQFGRIPDVPNTRIYGECKALFSQLTPEVAHDEMVRVVKNRGDRMRLREFIEGVPSSLKAASLSCRLTPSDRVALLTVLQRPVRECFPSLGQM